MRFAGSKLFTALMRPMVPMETRSSMPMPVLSNFRAMYTTRRRLRSISTPRTPRSPSLSRPSSSSSSSLERGGGSASLPPT